MEGWRQEIAEEGPRTKEMLPGTFLIWVDMIVTNLLRQGCHDFLTIFDAGCRQHASHASAMEERRCLILGSGGDQIRFYDFTQVG